MRYLLALPALVLLMGFSCSPPPSPPPPPPLHQVNLSWQLPPEYSGFVIYRSTDGVSYALLATITGKQTTYSDKAVQAGSTYFYKSRTFCSACAPNLSDFSNTVEQQVP